MLYTPKNFDHHVINGISYVTVACIYSNSFILGCGSLVIILILCRVANDIYSSQNSGQNFHAESCRDVWSARLGRLVGMSESNNFIYKKTCKQLNIVVSVYAMPS